jgi:ABC-type branched-subunit amino acid transport system ATPase component
VSVLTDVSLTVQAGQVHGLIGPNGSGKTTLLNCVSGLISSSGKFRLDGSPLGRRSEVRARTGIARTFQQPILENASALLENIRVGVDANRHVKTFGYILRLPSARREAVDSRRQAVDWLCTLGLYEDSDKPAGALPPGKQRLLEVGRALATHPRVILLDEPAAGLNQAEIDQLERTIRAVRDAGISVLLVDHHVDLVLGVCDEITVLANGRVIATGAPEEIRNSAAVLDAYLGRRRERSRVGARGEPS